MPMRRWGPRLDVATGGRTGSARPRAGVEQRTPSSGGGGRRRDRRHQSGAVGEVLIEFLPIGNTVRVSAMDPETLTEVTIVGPTSATEAELTRAVIAKLEYRLRLDRQ